MAGFSIVLNPTSDPLVTHTAQLDLSDGAANNGVGYRPTMADFPPPAPKPAYASSYDTEGSISSDEAHYENREITLGIRVGGSSAGNLESKLNALYKMVGLINREGGSLKLTTPNGTVCYFDLEREGAAVTPFDQGYAGNRRAEVELRFAARPFWRGAEVDLGSYSETTLPALVGLWPQPVFDSPDDIAGLECWLKPESLGSGGSSISTWTDSSGLGNNATQGTGANQPVVTAAALDGFKAATFDGSNDNLGVAGITNNDQTRTVFIVAKGTSPSSTDRMFQMGTGSACIRANDATNWAYAVNQAGGAVSLGGTPSTADLIAIRWNSTSSCDCYINGGTATNFDPNDTYSSTGPFPVQLGADSAGTNAFQGDIYEVIIYNSALGDTDLDKVRGYLSAKFPSLGAFGTAVGAQQTIKGDVPALGRLVITEGDADDRWVVIVGGQSRYYNSGTASTTSALFYQAEDLTELGTTTTTAGATGASGAGSNVQRNTDLTTTYQAVLKSEIDATNAALTHKGTFRVWARCYRPTGNTGAVSVRLEWAVGDYTRVTQNVENTVTFAADELEGQWLLLDLGLVSIDPDQTRWEFRPLAKSTAAGDEIDFDCFYLFPTEVVYTELSGRSQLQTPSSYVARDEFDQTSGSVAGKLPPVPSDTVALTTPFGVATTNLLTSTAHGFVAGDAIQFTALTGGAGLSTNTPYFVIATGLTANDFKVSATAGGAEVDFTTNITAGTFRRAWSGFGDADDFTVDATNHWLTRTAISDADVNTGRYLLSGAANQTAIVAQVDYGQLTSPSGGTGNASHDGPLVRYTDTNNWLKAVVVMTIDNLGSKVYTLQLVKRVAGTVTTLGTVALGSTPTFTLAGAWVRIRVQVTASGVYRVWYGTQTDLLTERISGLDADLATGGALATGRVGVYDTFTGTSLTRAFDNFFAFVPTPDAAVFASRTMTLKHDRATRQDSTGSFSSPVSEPRGRYLKIPPSGPEARSTRLIVAGPAGPTFRDGVIIDPLPLDTSAQLFVTPRGLVVPEA